MRPIKVLIVDDSTAMRALIAVSLSGAEDIVVVGEAGDPYAARQAIKDLSPDVVTLDVEMPRMNGIEFLEKIMRLRPLPVIMISSLTKRSAAVTIEALQLGAVDCIAKPDAGNPDAFAELPEKIRAAAGVRVAARAERSSAKASSHAGDYQPTGDLVAIGASTGGVEALIEIVSALPANAPATIVTLHMPAQFTHSFADRLARLSPLKVQEAGDGRRIEPGNVYVAPGTHTHLEVVRSGGLICRLRRGDPVSGHRPSVDVMFTSVANVCGAKSVGVILTGMGRDGAAGLLAMRKAGARTIGQDEISSIVYGMPKVAHEIGAVQRQAPLSQIANEILKLTNVSKTQGALPCRSQTA